jgi:ATP-binding cassette subfamily F protein 3
MGVPANLIQLQSVSKSFGTKTLFSDATFSVDEGEHIGVIGPNGAGKTTLFQILAGESEIDRGKVARSRNLRLGYLRQHDTWNESETLESYLSTSVRTPLWDLKRLGHDLGLSEAQFSQPIKSLSGGYRMRAKLLHLLGEEPNLMLLDEPTNYLDLETLLVLENFLQEFRGAFLLISHDREFLRRTTDHILEVENGDFVKFSGHIDDYFEQKEMLRTQLEKQALGEAAKRKEILDFAARFGAKASKARQVQSRLKQLDKMETIELKRLPVGAKIRIPEPSHTGKVAFEVLDADLGYTSDRPVLQRVDLIIESKDHLGIVGFNGAGKSTLLKSIAKELAPLHGEIEWGYQVKAAYYAQHIAERLNPAHSVFEALSDGAHPSVRVQEILDLAGSLLFSGDQVKKKIQILSGGEKARVALGKVLLQKAPLLLLDEPTNHLDFYTVESLTQALEDYPGAVVVVSHDRGFVRRIATKILEVKAGRVRIYPGAYDDYVWNIQRHGHLSEEDLRPLKPRAPQTAPEPKLPTKSASNEIERQKKRELESQKRTFDKIIQDLDRKIKILETRMVEQSQKLSSATGEEAQILSRDLSASQRKIQELESEMLKALEQREETT